MYPYTFGNVQFVWCKFTHESNDYIMYIEYLLT